MSALGRPDLDGSVATGQSLGFLGPGPGGNDCDPGADVRFLPGLGVADNRTSDPLSLSQ